MCIIKPYSLYEKCAALALYKKLFGNFQSNVIDSLYQTGKFIDMGVYARYYRDFSEKTISPNESLFDILVENIEFKKGIYSNRTFQFTLGEKNIIIPAELINSNTNLTLNDVSDWYM